MDTRRDVRQQSSRLEQFREVKRQNVSPAIDVVIRDVIDAIKSNRLTND